jgi:hypothetical protein
LADIFEKAQDKPLREGEWVGIPIGNTINGNGYFVADKKTGFSLSWNWKKIIQSLPFCH